MAKIINSYDLIIFDNDGVLVDSEILYKQANCEALQNAGFSIDQAWLYKYTTGLNWKGVSKVLENQFGNIPDDNASKDMYEIFEKLLPTLNAVENTHTVLESLGVPFCIGTNGNFETTLKKLAVAKLDDYFALEHIFTAHHEKVKRSKPAPDLYLFIAGQMKVDASKCLVVEDSPSGVVAGKAAGMYVVGFTGGSHSKYMEGHEGRLLEAGADVVIDDLTKLLTIIK